LNAGAGMSQLPDPRRYGSSVSGGDFAALVEKNASGNPDAQAELDAWLTGCLEESRDREIFGALRQAPSQTAYRALWDRVCLAADRHGSAADKVPITARLFALPIVMVTATRSTAVVSGALPDIDGIRVLLERHGAVGATRNFGLGNALCSAEALERWKPSDVYRWSADWSAGAPREMAPQDIAVQAGRVQVHLRFLVGAGIAPQDAPSFLETAANIGAWGLPLTRALVRQLAQPALDLLAMPRAPVGVLKAAHTGRRSELEVAFNLFVSNAVRNFRSSVGDPAVAISAHRLEAGGAEVRVSMSSPFDDTLLEGFRWPLHPLDELDGIVGMVTELLRDCRVSDMSIVAAVLPERLEQNRLFLRADEAVRFAAKH
jgi:hypothetical protein